MLFSVLTRKGKVPRLSEVHALAKRRGFQHQPATLPWTIGPTPSLGPPTSAQTPEETDLSPQCQAPRPCPAIITEGTRRPRLSLPSGHPNEDQVPGAVTHGPCGRH